MGKFNIYLSLVFNATFSNMAVISWRLFLLVEETKIPNKKEILTSGWCSGKSLDFAWLMVFNATFNNTSVISWRSILLVEETGVPSEYHRPVASQWQT